MSFIDDIIDKVKGYATEFGDKQIAEIKDYMGRYNTFENVDNSKVELVEYNKSSGFDFTSNKTLLYIAGAIIIWQLLKRK